MGLSALIVRVPEAEPVVGSLREQYDQTASLGVPAHITILMPFMPPQELTPQVLVRLQGAISSVAPFAFRLAEVGRWSDTTYLAPEPAKPFINLTNAVAAAFPAFPPYAGRHAEVVPHLTVAYGTEARASAAESELKLRLGASGSIASYCAAVELIENSTGLWRRMHVLQLASGAA